MKQNPAVLADLAARNERIVDAAKQGVPRATLARRYSITSRRVTQILHKHAAGIPAKRFHPASIIERSRMLWDRGLSAGEIASVITRDGYDLTKDAVIGIAHRNGFTPKPSPIRHRSTP